MLCVYGCGQTSNFILKNGKQCCSKHYSSCPSIRQKSSASLKDRYRYGKIISGKEKYKNFSKSTKKKMAWSKGKTLISNDVIFVENSYFSNGMVKQRIIQNDLLEYKCKKCEIDSWMGETIVLDLDHINGNNTDNRLDNLRFLCPNCHSQTETYKGRNKNTGKQKVSDNDLLGAYNNCGNIRKALISVGLAAKGGNYERLKKIIENHTPT